MRRVLFVDDEVHVLRALERMLRSQRDAWECHFVDAPRRALEMLDTLAPDAIVSDMQMPELDGASLLASAAHRRPRAARFILSGEAGAGSIVRMARAAHRCLAKPCPGPSLIAALESALGPDASGDPALLEHVYGLAALPVWSARHDALRRQLAGAPSAARDAEVISLIEGEPAVAAKLMQVATWTAPGLTAAPAHVGDAYYQLGADTVRALLESAVLAPTPDAATTPHEREIWRRCGRVGPAARAVARLAGLDSDATAQVVMLALWSTAAPLALDAARRAEHAAILRRATEATARLCDLERAAFGYSSGQAFDRLLRLWGLEQGVERVDRTDDDPVAAPLADRSAAALAAAARRAASAPGGASVSATRATSVCDSPRRPVSVSVSLGNVVGGQLVKRSTPSDGANATAEPSRADASGIVVENRDLVRLERDRVATALAAMKAGWWDYDLTSGAVACAPRTLELLGISTPTPTVAQFLAQPDDADVERVHAGLADLVAGRAERLEVELGVQLPNGAAGWVRLQARVSATTSAGEPVRITGAVSDVTHERNQYQQAHVTRKLEAIGTLTAGVAHEINTPLQFVSNNLDFLASHYAAVALRLGEAPREVGTEGTERAHHDVASAIAESIDGLERVRKIVRALKEFAHQGRGGREDVDVNQMVQNAITLTRSEWKFVADLEHDLSPGLPPVDASGHECGQLLVNLIVNAAHAVQAAGPDRGRSLISVRTRLVDGMVEIRVTDTGTGIPPEVRGRIFEPFFTTKGIGKGTGQGLATARTIVERHGGTIDFETEVGRGTTFIVRFPAAHGSQQAA